MRKEKTGGIYFKVSDEDRVLIERKMELANVRNRSAYIRKMCIDGYIIRLDLPELDACAKYLRAASIDIMTFLDQRERICFAHVGRSGIAKNRTAKCRSDLAVW